MLKKIFEKKLRSLPNSNKYNHVLLLALCNTGEDDDISPLISPSVNVLIDLELGELVMYNLRSSCAHRKKPGCCKLASH